LPKIGYGNFDGLQPENKKSNDHSGGFNEVDQLKIPIHRSELDYVFYISHTASWIIFHTEKV
jgi:hypothetical protein